MKNLYTTLAKDLSASHSLSQTPQITRAEDLILTTMTIQSL